MKPKFENRKELIKFAIKEIINLKKNLRPVEKSRLIFKEFNPNSTSNCIYGLATGYCFSDRAKQLIRRCAPKIINSDSYRNADNQNIEQMPKKLIRKDILTYYWSPLESVIAIYGLSKYRKNTLAFIRDETNELKLKEVLNG